MLFTMGNCIIRSKHRKKKVRPLFWCSIKRYAYIYIYVFSFLYWRQEQRRNERTDGVAEMSVPDHFSCFWFSPIDFQIRSPKRWVWFPKGIFPILIPDSNRSWLFIERKCYFYLFIYLFSKDYVFVEMTWNILQFFFSENRE